MLYPNSTCLVTGGSNGIGKELCLILIKAGYQVVVVDIKEPDFDCQQYQPLDLGGSFILSSIRETILRLKDIPSLLVNCAGIGLQKEVTDVAPVNSNRIVQINYTAPIRLCQKTVELWRQYHMHGHIVNISSGQIFFQLPTWGVYTASKAALAAASETMHYELLKDNIFVTTVYPFMVNTGFYDKIKTQDGSWASRMSMKLLPYYSYTPKHVAKQIYKAIESHKRVEMCSPINYLPKLLPMGIVRRLAAKVLIK